jgi:hypothetical protein
LGSDAKLEWKLEPEGLTIERLLDWPCWYAVAFKIGLDEITDNRKGLE